VAAEKAQMELAMAGCRPMFTVAAGAWATVDSQR
tara:strand:+ start:549 stop:650 length:102 start_codon:yes stop_codon:yes gene_type:complete